MASGDSFQLYGPPAHRGEEEGLEWLRAALPRHDPYAAWSLFTLQTGTGQRYEIDALVLTAHALFVVELKSWRGRVVDGSVSELVTSSPERGPETVDHPLPLLTKKMHALRDRIQRVARQLKVDDKLERLRFEELVWLSHATGFDRSKVPDHSAARAHVIFGRQELDDALRRASFPGADSRLKNNAYAREVKKALARVLAAPEFGLRPRPKELSLLGGRVKIGGLIEEGRDFQDRWSIEPNEHSARRRVRSYLVPRDDAQTRQQVERRVQKEVAVLRKLGEHPDILALDAYDPDGPHGPALVFRGFEGTTLDRFLRQQRNEEGASTVGLEDRLTILQRVAHALEFCHRNEIAHGALSPEAVLVRRLNSAAESRDGRSLVEVKLTRFALARVDDSGASSTDPRLLTRLGGTTAGVYEAPEVARGARPDPASDLFSLGALACFVFSEQPPAPSAGALQERLIRDQGLDLSAVRPDLSAASEGRSVGDVIFDATFIDPDARREQSGGPLRFVEALEEALTAPELSDQAPAEAQLDPLQAGKRDRLGDLTVVSELGTGTTAKALKVFRGDRSDVFYALKIPLSDEQNDRIAREGEVLSRLGLVPGLSNITRLVEQLSFAGRTCLLVEFAGDRTLAEELREEGPLSLEFARRWGEELLLALRGLESEGIQHRDLKPANIGLTTGAQKQKKRLLLFDFSLSGADGTNLEMGTPAYKDPGLYVRKHWDDAADRWAAAVTLYEMLSGTRPAPAPATSPDDLAVRLEPERFDASVRERLVAFFTRAFRFGAERRFSTADDMRDAFVKALEQLPDAAEVEDELRAIDVELSGLEGQDALQKLELSAQAANALDRMGIYTLQDLAQLKPNWLSGVRGVGRRTARFLVELAVRVGEHLDRVQAEPAQAFLPEWSGEVVALAPLRGKVLAERFVDALASSGIHDSAQLAAAPRSVVRNLINRARAANAAVTVKDVTAWLNSLVDDSRPPATLRAAVHLFARPPSDKNEPALERFRVYVGLTQLDGCPPGNAAALAAHFKVSRQAVSLDLQKSRGRWKLAGPTGAVLRQAFNALYVPLTASGGVAPLASAAEALLKDFPPEPDLTPADVRRYAEALTRIVAEVDLADLDVPHGARLLVKPRPGGTLVALDKTALDLADVLGDAADAAVGADQVLVEHAAAARLRSALDEAAETLDEERLEYALSLSDRSLLELATVAAERARLSVRGELYPRGLDAAKAVMLSAPALQGQLTVDEVKRRIRARYPDAVDLPDRTALDDLLKPLRLSFNPTAGAFVPNLPPSSQGSTELFSSGSRHLIRPHARPADDAPGRQASRTFEELLDHAAETRRLRVLLWRGKGVDRQRTPDVQSVAKAVAHRLGGRHVSVDALLIDAAKAVAFELGMKNGLAPALKADLAGPAAQGWSKLVELMAKAADRVHAQLLESDSPTVLTELGLLARYGQLGLVEKLAHSHRAGQAKAPTLLVLPVHDGEGAVVQVGLDVAEWLGADPGTGLVPVRGPLNVEGEIAEVPAAWASDHVRRLDLDQRGIA